jgi:hypothetical protein
MAASGQLTSRVDWLILSSNVAMGNFDSVREGVYK